MGPTLLAALLAVATFRSALSDGSQSEACFSNANDCAEPLSAKGSSVLQARSKGTGSLNSISEEDEDEATVAKVVKTETKKSNKKKQRKVKGSSLVQISDRGQPIKAAVFDDEDTPASHETSHTPDWRDMDDPDAGPSHAGAFLQSGDREGTMTKEELEMIDKLVAEYKASPASKEVVKQEPRQTSPPSELLGMIKDLKMVQTDYTPNTPWPGLADNADEEAMKQGKAAMMAQLSQEVKVTKDDPMTTQEQMEDIMNAGGQEEKKAADEKFDAMKKYLDKYLKDTREEAQHFFDALKEVAEKDTSSKDTDMIKEMEKNKDNMMMPPDNANVSGLPR